MGHSGSLHYGTVYLALLQHEFIVPATVTTEEALPVCLHVAFTVRGRSCIGLLSCSDTKMFFRSTTREVTRSER